LHSLGYDKRKILYKLVKKCQNVIMAKHLVSIHDLHEFRLPEPKSFLKRHADAFEKETVLLATPVPEMIMQSQ